MDELHGGPSVAYVPGQWVAVVGRDQWALINADPEDDLVVGVWGEINGEKAVYSTRDLLEARVRAGVRTEFALVVRETARTKVVLAGSATAEVVTEQSTSQFVCPDWSVTVEAVIEGPLRKISIGGPQISDGVGLPVAGGVVSANRIDLDWIAASLSNRASMPKIGLSNSQDSRPTAIRENFVATGAAAPADVDSSPEVGSPVEARHTSRPSVDAGVERVSGSGDEGDADDGGYGYLFGNTVRRSVDDAAVHAPEEEEIQPYQRAIASEETTVPESPEEHVAGAPVRNKTTPATGLIDAIPWGAPKQGPAHGDISAMNEPVGKSLGSGDAIVSDAIEDLGLTVSRDVAAAAARDIEGQSDVDAVEAGPAVHAIYCESGHPNPTHADQCRICGDTIESQAPVTVPRPVLGLLRLSSGGVIALDRGVLIGRSPSEGRMVGGERPHIVKLASTDQDISRNHIEICLDDWHVLVTDLNSTNGTVITRPGRDPERLRPDQPTMIEPGTVVALADDLTLTFEATE